ncbi:flagellar hook capping protein [Synergistales bacterium]|nr:flagellar hook capping protein [Synergistales bacterium]
MPNVNGISGISSDQLNSASKAVSNELGKDAFLKLLIAELSNQDPMDPMSDREFIAQMAQFSSLEQMTNMAKAFEGMSSMQEYSAVSYIGKVVAFQFEGADGVKTPVADIVLAVWYDAKEGPILETAGYGDIPLSQIEGVTDGSTLTRT